MTSAVWIDNCRKGFFYKKRKTLYINTWHGSGMQKKCELDAVGHSLGIDYVKKAKRDSKQIDLFISDCDALTKLIKKSFWFSGPVLKVSYPRYSPLYELNQSKKNILRKKLNISADAYVILYCPTFRDSYDLAPYSIDFKKLKNRIESIFKKNVVILNRLHPNFINKDIDRSFFDHTINVSSYCDAQELLAVSDALISDYSSIIFDFTITKKPAFRFITDFNNYKSERDFYYDIDTYPWPYANNTDELVELFLNFDSEQYLEHISRFYKQIGFYRYNSPDMISQMISDYVEYKMTKKELFLKFKEYIEV